MNDEHHSLIAFSPRLAEVISRWACGRAEVEAWCSLPQESVSPETIVGWATSVDVSAFVFVVDDVPVGYGELWIDDDEEEVELGHLIVDPAVRNRSIGRRLVRALTAEARNRHTVVALRVRAENQAAIRSYSAAGFTRVSPEEEAAWNDGQPHRYVWMIASPTG